MKYYKRLSVISNSITAEVFYIADIHGVNTELVALHKTFHFPILSKSREKTYIKAKNWLDYNYELVEKYTSKVVE